MVDKEILNFEWVIKEFFCRVYKEFNKGMDGNNSSWPLQPYTSCCCSMPPGMYSNPMMWACSESRKEMLLWGQHCLLYIDDAGLHARSDGVAAKSKVQRPAPVLIYRASFLNAAHSDPTAQENYSSSSRLLQITSRLQ
jgi:hypothetical protein